MLTAARPYSDSIHSKSKHSLNPVFLNQTGLFNKQRYKRSDSDSDIQGAPSKKPRLELSSGEYPASGLKSTLHGTIYQLKLLMLFLKRGLDKGYEFSLATEMNDAEQFDDLVFEYKKTDNDKKSYIFLQAKHKHELEDKDKIRVGNLMSTDKKNPFMLIKYFLSFLKIRKNFGEGGDFFIFTNTKFDIIDGSLKLKKPKKVIIKM